MFKELGLTKGERSLQPSLREPGGKHLSFITHFICPACLITGNTLAQGSVWRGVGERKAISLLPEPDLPGAALPTTKCSSSQQDPR